MLTPAASPICLDHIPAHKTIYSQLIIPWSVLTPLI